METKEVPMRVLPVFVLASAIFVGCAVGRKMSYQSENVPVDYKPSKNVVITFHDERDQVVSGKQKPTFVGQLSSGMGIPYNMQTGSGNPLAVEFASALNNAILNKGLQSTTITLAHTDSVSTVLDTFAKMSQERLLFFKIHKWEARSIPGFTMMHYEILSDFELNVYDTSGNILATSTAKDLTEKKQDAALS